MDKEEIGQEIEKLPLLERLLFTAEELGKAYTAVFVDAFRKIPWCRRVVKGQDLAFWIGHVVQFLPPAFLVGLVVLFLRH